jgi:hypothetical protein
LLRIGARAFLARLLKDSSGIATLGTARHGCEADNISPKTYKEFSKFFRSVHCSSMASLEEDNSGGVESGDEELWESSAEKYILVRLKKPSEISPQNITYLAKLGLEFRRF